MLFQLMVRIGMHILMKTISTLMDVLQRAYYQISSFKEMEIVFFWK